MTTPPERPGGTDEPTGQPDETRQIPATEPGAPGGGIGGPPPATGGPGGPGRNPAVPWLLGTLVVALVVFLVIALVNDDEPTDTTGTTALTDTTAVDTTAPGEETTVPGDTTTVPEGTTTVPEDTTTVPDTTTPPEAGLGGECAVDELNLVEPGQLTVATGEPAFEPWVVGDDPTSQEGFEAAVVYEMAEVLGFEPGDVSWIRTGFDEAIAPGDKPFDINVQQYSITEQRDEVVDFSAPYYVTQQALVAFEDSEVTQAASIEDLASYRLGAQIGTTSLAYIEEVIEPETPAAVYDTNADAKAALDAGQIDAIVFDLPTAYYITAVEIPEASIVGALPASEDQADEFGMLMEEGNPLKDCIDQAIEVLREEGTLDDLAEQWLQQEGDIPELSS